jgi:hypothetical protein
MRPHTHDERTGKSTAGHGIPGRADPYGTIHIRIGGDIMRQRKSKILVYAITITAIILAVIFAVIDTPLV